MKIENSIVILAKGEKPHHNIPVRILKNAEKIICCDGAISFLEEQEIAPHIIVGDCDSITSKQKEKYKSIIHIDSSSEYNDLQKALRYCIASGWKNVTLLGADGERDDHFLANIGVLMHYADRLCLKMVTNHGIFTPIHCTTTFESYPEQQISVFSFSSDAEITFHGLKYPVHKHNFKELWEGSLNEATAHYFTVEIEKNAAILVFAAF